jgi:hypothetical protein
MPPTRTSRVPVIRAAAVASVVSGAPSTAYALLTGRDPLEATQAAGAMVAPRSSRAVQLAAAAPVHLVLSFGWTAVLARVVPADRSLGARILVGMTAGAAIAALDLGVIGRRIAVIRALPVLPQVADHLAFGAVAGACLSARDRHRHASGAGQDHRERD